ncbi:polyunsaturated fatty acid 5-lipoxygenase-like isoform X3 [Salvelinus alpinus]|uniref:polyunsaturated fatty acid 5-lipoxygenase-like isoform X3 n=1 Tax=Salvelinus alpinus TaxID=8036 RepID=UPI0039FB8A6C
MEEYNVTVATGTSEYSGTNNYIYITLVGEKGDSEKTTLDNPGLDFCRGAVDEYKVCSPAPLGRVLLVRLEKQRYWVEDNWFCLYVTVAPPGGGTALTFPCYRWLIGNVKVELREGTAMRLSDDTSTQLLAHRKAELQERQAVYRWVTWAPGIPKCIDAKTEADLHQDVRFDNEKRSDFEGSLQYALLELSLKKLAIMFGKSWDNLDDFKRCFWKLRSPISEYCMEHWKEDSFFGYQCLNGSNPRMIQCCKKLPGNFPVSGDMVQGSLAPRTTLEKELKLGQTPGLDTPIFLPKNPPLAWLLAKIWVRHSEFQVFQLLSHLLRTHLVVEVFCVSTLRQLPAVHPVYKLLAPHLRYTLEINCRGRTQLLSADGIFKRVVSTGGEGLLILAQNEYKVLTYRSLQPYQDFQQRGASKLRNYFYREYSLMLWDAIHSFVSGMVSLYYHYDSDVVEDTELQAWIKDIAEEGFVDVPRFGLARELHNKTELITLLSVAIFTSSVQHAATNNGQFDWCAWVPNTPCTMRHPPPTDKDAVTMEMIMDTLPDVSQTCLEMAITWHLGRPQPDAIPLGQYREQYFTESQAQEVIDKFRQELKEIEEHILTQNEGLELPYLFLLPSRIENSITI